MVVCGSLALGRVSRVHAGRVSCYKRKADRPFQCPSGYQWKVRATPRRLVAKVKNGHPTRLELYDLSNDPDSIRDVSSDQPDVVNALRLHLPSRDE